MTAPQFSFGWLTVITRKVFAHSGMISFMLAMGTLIYSVIVINEILALPTDEEYRANQLSTSTRVSFDQKTIERIRKLNVSTTPAPFIVPRDDYNPFRSQ